MATTESGRALQVAPLFLMTTGGTDNYGPYNMKCGFTGLYPGEDKVIITLYDASREKPCYDEEGNFTGADPGLFQVAASFTLDLAAGTADLNWDYLNEGYERLDGGHLPGGQRATSGGLYQWLLCGQLPAGDRPCHRW